MINNEYKSLSTCFKWYNYLFIWFFILKVYMKRPKKHQLNILFYNFKTHNKAKMSSFAS